MQEWTVRVIYFLYVLYIFPYSEMNDLSINTKLFLHLLPEAGGDATKPGYLIQSRQNFMKPAQKCWPTL